MPKAERDIIIESPIERVFDIITDYERYPEFLPEMKAARLESRHDGVAIVHFELELIMRISYSLRLQEDGPHSLSWSLEDAKMMQVNNGGWRLEPTDEGHTHAVYGLEIKLRGLIPKSVTTRLVEVTLPRTLENFKRRAEAVSSAD